MDFTGIPQDVQGAVFDAFSRPGVDFTGIPQDVQDAVFDAFSRPGVDSDVVEAIYKSFSQSGPQGGYNPTQAGRFIPPPPPVSGPDYSLDVGHGFVWQQYEAAFQEAWNPNNPTWARVTMGAFVVLGPHRSPAPRNTWGRSIANIPFMVENAGLSIGEHIGRAVLWSEQGEMREAAVEGLQSVESFSQGFTVAGSVRCPLPARLSPGWRLQAQQVYCWMTPQHPAFRHRSPEIS